MVISSGNLWGFILAFLSALFFGIYMVPRRYCKLKAEAFLLGMTIGILLITWIILRIEGLSLAFPLKIKGLSWLCGILWALGTLCFSQSVMYIGLSRSAPVKNTAAVVGTIFGLIIFKEYTKTDPFLSFSGSLLIVIAAIFFGRAQGEDEETNGQGVTIGITLALMASLFYALYTIPFKVVMGYGVKTEQLIALMGQGCFASALIIYFVRGSRWRELVAGGWMSCPLAIIGGGLWTLGVFYMAKSIELIGLAVAWPLTNLNTVVAVLYGIFIFKEISLNRYSRQIALGLVAVVVGVILLGLSR